MKGMEGTRSSFSSVVCWGSAVLECDFLTAGRSLFTSAFGKAGFFAKGSISIRFYLLRLSSVTTKKFCLLGSCGQNTLTSRFPSQ